MSRIEEAFAQASATIGPRAAVVGHESTRSRPDDQTLAYYPREAAGSTQDQAVRSEPERRVESTEAAADPRLVLGHADPVALEQYRRLAATLHGLQVEHGTKILMVTSALPREGKTLTITNLALTLSQSYGRRVLLVDADLRRPSVHDLLGLSNARGLSDALRTAGGPLSLFHPAKNLSVLPGGRASSNPIAALTSDRMATLLEESASVFDWVLVDTPPVGIMADAHLLARLMHGVIFVIGAGSTPYTLVQRAVAEIGREHIIGTVLNRIAEGSNPATGYYHEYYGVPAAP